MKSATDSARNLLAFKTIRVAADPWQLVVHSVQAPRSSFQVRSCAQPDRIIRSDDASTSRREWRALEPLVDEHRDRRRRRRCGPPGHVDHVQRNERSGTIEPPRKCGNTLEKLVGNGFTGSFNCQREGWFVCPRFSAKPVLEFRQSIFERGHVLRPGRWCRHVDAQAV